MKERPILMSGPMVRAILEGRKTQTRRVVKPQPGALARFNHYDGFGSAVFTDGSTAYSRFGGNGDQLWVRENLQIGARNNPKPRMNHIWRYSADNVPVPMLGDAADLGEMDYRPSIFMPRWASRITLEIKAVRVERLQEISLDDAMAEGCVYRDHPFQSPQVAYQQLWDSLNGKKHPWASNCWVWVIEFAREFPK